jgi:hypothetical protein
MAYTNTLFIRAKMMNENVKNTVSYFYLAFTFTLLLKAIAQNKWGRSPTYTAVKVNSDRSNNSFKEMKEIL